MTKKKFQNLFYNWNESGFTEAQQFILQLWFYYVTLQGILEKYESSPDGLLLGSLTVSIFMLMDVALVFVIFLAVTTLLPSANTVGVGDPVNREDSHPASVAPSLRNVYYNSGLTEPKCMLRLTHSTHSAGRSCIQQFYLQCWGWKAVPVAGNVLGVASECQRSSDRSLLPLEWLFSKALSSGLRHCSASVPQGIHS